MNELPKDPFAPPRASELDPDPFAGMADETEVFTPTWKTKFAWGSVAGAGFISMVASMQNQAPWILADPTLRFVPIIMGGLGFAAIVFGGKLMQLRAWAALAGAIVSVLLTIVFCTWILVMATLGVYLLLQLMVPMVSGAAVVFSLLALPRCRLADEARRRIEAE